MLLIQQFYYGIFIVTIGIAIGVQHGWESGLKTALYCLILFQFVIFWLNRKTIKSGLWPDIKDRDE